MSHSAATASPQARQMSAHPYRAVGWYRLLLSLMVLVSHSSAFLPPVVGTLALGNLGVFSFFVLSGFVIAEAMDVFYKGAPGRFLMNRMLKLYPAYLAATLLALVLVLTVPLPQYRTDAWAVFVNLSLVTAYLPSGNTVLWISVVWAVIVELQFYLAAAAVFFAAYSFGTPRLVGAAALAALAAYLGVEATDGYHRFYGALRHAPFFVAGVSLYFAMTRPRRSLWLLTVAAYVLSLRSYWVYNASLGEARLITTVLFAVTSASLVWATRLRLPQLGEVWDKRAGNLTYSVYLVHFPLVAAIATLGLSGDVSMALVLASTLICALIVVHGVESPVTRLRDRIRGLRLYS